MIVRGFFELDHELWNRLRDSLIRLSLIGSSPSRRYNWYIGDFFLRLNMCLMSFFSKFMSFVMWLPLRVRADSPEVIEGFLKVLCIF